MNMPVAPEGYNYDLSGLFFFEVYPDGHVNHVPNDRKSIIDKDDNSIYGAYFRAVRHECDLYFSSIPREGHTIVRKIEDLEGLADSLGIMRPTGHVHEIRANYNVSDTGSGRYALLDIEFRCGCMLCNSNKRIIAEHLKARYGWQIILSSIDSMPLTRRTIRVERNSIDDSKMPR